MLVTLYKIGEGYFRFLSTNGFQVNFKTENERFTAAGSPFGRPREKLAPIGLIG